MFNTVGGRGHWQIGSKQSSNHQNELRRFTFRLNCDLLGRDSDLISAGYGSKFHATRPLPPIRSWHGMDNAGSFPSFRSPRSSGGHKSPSHQGTSLAEPLPSFYFNDTAMVATMIGAHRGVNIAFQHAQKRVARSNICHPSSARHGNRPV
jgi:hypothetical protein